MSMPDLDVVDDLDCHRPSVLGPADVCAHCRRGISVTIYEGDAADEGDGQLWLCPDCAKTLVKDYASRVCGHCWRPLLADKDIHVGSE